MILDATCAHNLEIDDRRIRNNSIGEELLLLDFNTFEVFIVIDARIHSTLFRQEDNQSTAPLHLMKHQDQQRNQILFHRRWHNSPPRLSAKFRSSCIYCLGSREPAPQSKSSPFGTPLV